mmetsp:Transcript_30408/g.94348  ORF Transcript_30408/g.94348 Transcript_30408/m.94348 type:complete len:252 (+) Transcript_30408:130-885(+)
MSASRRDPKRVRAPTCKHASAHAIKHACTPANLPQPSSSPLPRGASPRCASKASASSQSNHARCGLSPSNVRPRGRAGDCGASAKRASWSQDSLPSCALEAPILPRVTCGVQAPSPSNCAKKDTGKATPTSLTVCSTASRSLSKAATIRFALPGGKNSNPRKAIGASAAPSAAARASPCSRAACTAPKALAGNCRKCSPKKRNVMCRTASSTGLKVTSAPLAQSSVAGSAAMASAARPSARMVSSSRTTAR